MTFKLIIAQIRKKAEGGFRETRTCHQTGHKRRNRSLALFLSLVRWSFDRRGKRRSPGTCLFNKKDLTVSVKRKNIKNKLLELES